MSGVLNNRAVANQQQNITSINSLIGNNDVSYKDLMKNVKGVGHFNMGEIVFEKGKKTGSFSRVNNHAGCLSIFNNVVTTAEQNRATNAAVFKALLQKYDNPGADSSNLLNQDFGAVYNNGKLDDEALKNLFEGKANPYLLEAFKFLVLEKDSAPLSRDELRLLDKLLAYGKTKPEAVNANMKLLGDLKAMKSGTAPIDLRKVTDSTKAEYWISGLHVKNLSPDEFKRLTTETVNKRAASARVEYSHFIGNGWMDACARLVLFNGMPELVNTVNENIRYTLARSLKVDGEKTVDRFLTLLTSGIEGGFESGWAAFVKKNKGLEARLEGKMMTLADLKKSVYNQLIDYLGECLHRHNPKLTPQIYSSSANNAFRNMYNGIRAKTTGENYHDQLSVKGRLLDRLMTHDYAHDPRFDEDNKGEQEKQVVDANHEPSLNLGGDPVIKEDFEENIGEKRETGENQNPMMEIGEKNQNHDNRPGNLFDEQKVHDMDEFIVDRNTDENLNKEIKSETGNKSENIININNENNIININNINNNDNDNNFSDNNEKIKEQKNEDSQENIINVIEGENSQEEIKIFSDESGKDEFKIKEGSTNEIGSGKVDENEKNLPDFENMSRIEGNNGDSHDVQVPGDPLVLDESGYKVNKDNELIYQGPLFGNNKFPVLPADKHFDARRTYDLLIENLTDLKLFDLDQKALHDELLKIRDNFVSRMFKSYDYRGMLKDPVNDVYCTKQNFVLDPDKPGVAEYQLTLQEDLFRTDFMDGLHCQFFHVLENLNRGTGEKVFTEEQVEKLKNATYNGGIVSEVNNVVWNVGPNNAENVEKQGKSEVNNVVWNVGPNKAENVGKQGKEENDISGSESGLKDSNIVEENSVSQDVGDKDFDSNIVKEDSFSQDVGDKPADNLEEDLTKYVNLDEDPVYSELQRGLLLGNDTFPVPSFEKAADVKRTYAWLITKLTDPELSGDDSQKLAKIQDIQKDFSARMAKLFDYEGVVKDPRNQTYLKGNEGLGEKDVETDFMKGLSIQFFHILAGVNKNRTDKEQEQVCSVKVINQLKADSGVSNLTNGQIRMNMPVYSKLLFGSNRFPVLPRAKANDAKKCYDGLVDDLMKLRNVNQPERKAGLQNAFSKFVQTMMGMYNFEDMENEPRNDQFRKFYSDLQLRSFYKNELDEGELKRRFQDGLLYQFFHVLDEFNKNDTTRLCSKEETEELKKNYFFARHCGWAEDVMWNVEFDLSESVPKRGNDDKVANNTVENDESLSVSEDENFNLSDMV